MSKTDREQKDNETIRPDDSAGQKNTMKHGDAEAAHGAETRHAAAKQGARSHAGSARGQRPAQHPTKRVAPRPVKRSESQMSGGTSPMGEQRAGHGAGGSGSSALHRANAHHRGAGYASHAPHIDAHAGTRPPRPMSYPTVRHGRRRSAHAPAGAIIALVACLVLLAAGGWWYFFQRSVTVTINGTEVSVRVGTPLQTVLADHDMFGAAPGRLLSVGGNVISEDGGNPSTVSLDGKELTQDEVNGLHIQDGETFTVADGTDLEEESTEETVEVAPGITKEEGGAVQYVSQWGKAGKKRVKKGSESGETVDVETLEEPVDMVVSSINPRPSSGKYVALTFDDGPSSYTPQILKVLKEKGACATFFNLGAQADADPSGSKAVIDGGNELASHTMSHKNLPNTDRDTLRSEITRAADALQSATGRDIQMIRAPYGAFTSTEWARAGDLISCNVLWNVDTLDWERPGADAIKKAAVSGAFNGAIILMHDGGGNRSQTVEALPGIIDELRDQGYEFVTVSELLKLDGRVSEDVYDGTVSMPEDASLPDV